MTAFQIAALYVALHLLWHNGLSNLTYLHLHKSLDLK